MAPWPETCEQGAGGWPVRHDHGVYRMSHRTTLIPIPILILAILVPRVAAQTAPRGDDGARIDALLARMTLEEKLGQLQQLPASGKTGELLEGQRDLIRRGLVGSIYQVRDARTANEIQRIAVEESPAKVPILFGFDVIHGYRTIFPIPLGEASSWDPSAAGRSSRIAAEEASAAGVRWAFAPMLDIARDPRWGRIAEGSGEDPYLGARMARARVRGFQGDDFAAPGRVVACAKHWVAYGAAEGGASTTPRTSRNGRCDRSTSPRSAPPSTRGSGRS